MRSNASPRDWERLMRESTTRTVNMSLYVMIRPPRPCQLGNGPPCQGSLRDRRGGQLAGLKLPHVRGSADDLRVGLPDDARVFAVVVDTDKQAAHRLEAGSLLVVALDHSPGCFGCVSPLEHRDLGRGVGVPLVQQRDIGGAELPLPHGVDLADGEAGVLLAGG